MTTDSTGPVGRLRCAVLDDTMDVAGRLADWASLDDRVEVVFLHRHLRPGEVVEALKDFDILVLMRERTPLSATMLGALDRLKLIVTAGSRNGALDVGAARARGIRVCGTSTPETPAVELTWALILGLMRRIRPENEALRASGPWQLGLGVDLAGKRLGIVGLGRLGARVARVAQAFEMTVSAWSHNLTEERCRSLGILRAATLTELMATSDVVTLHTVLSERTHHLIGRVELQAMKPSAFLINTSRAPVVDEAALIDVLERRRIAGAGLDVFSMEPLPDEHPFRRLDGVLATPHIGYVTEDAYRLIYEDAVEDIRAWIAGHPVREVTQDHPALHIGPRGPCAGGSRRPAADRRPASGTSPSVTDGLIPPARGERGRG